MNRRRLRSIVALGVLLAAIAGGCGVPTESAPRVITDDRLPGGLRSQPTSSVAAGPSAEPVTVWLVQRRQLLPVTRRIGPPDTPASIVQSLGDGPSASEQAQSLRSAIPDPLMIIDVTVAAGTATVELDPSFDQIPSVDQVLAIGQIVLTLTDLRGIGQVRFVHAATEIAVPRPDGSTTRASVSADDYRSLVSGQPA